jgi:hypothetical protein
LGRCPKPRRAPSVVRGVGAKPRHPPPFREACPLQTGVKGSASPRSSPGPGLTAGLRPPGRPLTPVFRSYQQWPQLENGSLKLDPDQGRANHQPGGRFFQRWKSKGELAAASREGAGFRPAITGSRCPKPRRSRGEAVGPAPAGVRPKAGVRSPPKVCESGY